MMWYFFYLMGSSGKEETYTEQKTVKHHTTPATSLPLPVPEELDRHEPAIPSGITGHARPRSHDPRREREAVNVVDIKLGIKIMSFG